MKKVISLLLALVMVVCINSATVAYAAKVNAEDKLVTVQKTTGFIPGKKAIVPSNCFEFICKVCEKLYGVTYWSEVMANSYSVNHTSNYYTVKKYTTSHTTPTTDDAKAIRDFFINNAQPGDVVHYGSLSGSSTHTIMIQHIDKNKMQIYHANYALYPYQSSDCHIDDIVWSSFVANPTKSIYNSDNTCYSLNAMFYNKMKTSGLGITINRYSKYTTYFNTINVSGVTTTSPSSTTSTTTTTTTTTTAPAKPAKITGLTATKIDKESIDIKWDKDDNSAKYYIYITNDTKGTNFNKTVTTNSTTLAGLTLNNTYTIKVRGVNSSGANGSYSDTITVTTKAPPSTKVSELKLKDKATTSLSYTWKKVANATKYYVYVSNDTKGTNFNKTVTTNSATLNGLTEGNVYSVKVKAYVGGKYGSYSSIVKACTKPAKVTLSTLTSPKKGQVKPTWKKVSGACSGYQIYVATDKEFKKNLKKASVSSRATVTTTISSLSSGKTYYVKVRAYKTVDGEKTYGSFSSVKSIKCK